MNRRTLSLALGSATLAAVALAGVVVATEPSDVVGTPLIVPVEATDELAEAAAQAAVAAGTADSAAQTQVSPVWVEQMSAKVGISTVALRAYATAQLAAPAECKLGWTTLAGIGWVESHHGTIAGRSLTPSGLPSSQITGIPLGDLDRAYGPMQFIPSTWKTWGHDGDGDGVADPQNINDAALSAAHYLCHSGPLTTPMAWSKAVFSYNHSNEYVQQVYAAAQRYAGLST